jgi:hypothetical protein
VRSTPRFGGHSRSRVLPHLQLLHGSRLPNTMLFAGLILIEASFESKHGPAKLSQTGPVVRLTSALQSHAPNVLVWSCTRQRMYPPSSAMSL